MKTAGEVKIRHCFMRNGVNSLEKIACRECTYAVVFTIAAGWPGSTAEAPGHADPQRSNCYTAVQAFRRQLLSVDA